MITCDLLGPGDGTANYGLCNQMFQIASLISHAHDSKLEVTFPQVKYSSFGNYGSNIFRQVPSFDIVTAGYSYLNIGFEYSSLPQADNIIYRGYFQDERYFKHNRKLILDLFKPSKEIVEYIQSKYSDILSKKTIALHIRRGDYVALPNHHPLISPEYYMRGINIILEQSQAEAYVIFSDDIDWCKSVFGISEEIYYIEGEEDYIDLYLMSMCTHNIIANSTFSWWAAWLNKNPDKVVVAPKTWFGPAIQDKPTDNIIPLEWIRI